MHTGRAQYIVSALVLLLMHIFVLARALRMVCMHDPLIVLNGHSLHISIYNWVCSAHKRKMLDSEGVTPKMTRLGITWLDCNKMMWRTLKRYRL